MTSKRNHAKMHHKILHALPFVASRKRRKGFEITRRWGDWILHVTALETVNHYDLITLLLLAREYQEGRYEVAGENKGRRLIQMDLDIAQWVKERGIQNQWPNRRTLVNSLKRLKYVDLEFRYPDEGRVVSSWLIYEVDYDEKGYQRASVLVNEKFLRLCLKKGLLVNWHRLTLYKDNGHAVLLDIYLQGTKTKRKGQWAYREWISEDEVFELLYPRNQETPLFTKRREAREAFRLIYEAGDLPLYEYDKVRRRWERKWLIAAPII